jgi:hypothetical protein
MTNTQVILLIVAVALVIGVILVLLRVQKSRRLRARFGPEYQRAVQESGSPIRGEERLTKLEQRVERFKIHELTASDRARFTEAWRLIQAKFVDDPKIALVDGDRLIGEVMTARGYPVVDFGQQAADLSVNHPFVVEHYRAGHEITQRHSQGRASTEDLRQAMIHYRSLFDDLVGTTDTQARAAVISR